jgi:hypothetical protein
VADIIEIAKLHEPREATDRLDAALSPAADATATGAPSVDSWRRLLPALLPAFAPGLAWELRYVGAVV